MPWDVSEVRLKPKKKFEEVFEKGAEHVKEVIDYTFRFETEGFVSYLSAVIIQLKDETEITYILSRDPGLNKWDARGDIVIENEEDYRKALEGLKEEGIEIPLPEPDRATKLLDAVTMRITEEKYF